MSIKVLNKFIHIAEEIAKKQGVDIKNCLKIGDSLLQEYKTNGYIKRLFLEMLNYDYLSFVPLLEYLIEKNGIIDKVKSPVEDNGNSEWMLRASFCFVNIRAIGKEESKPGDIINCIKLLPVLRDTSIHLAPFFECCFGIVYAIDSLDVINEEIINKEFYSYGMDGEEQIIFLIDFLHLLGKTVGFDLEPHTSQYSRVVIENPEYFRWIKLCYEKNFLFNGISQEEMLKKEWQSKIIEEVKEVKNFILSKYGLKNLSQKGIERITKKAHREIISELINRGLWTIPSHTWKGAGIPAFKRYIKNGNYPEFEYLSWENEDHKDHAFGILTPYKFYDNLPINKVPPKNSLLILDKNVFDFFSDIFINIQKKYNFDFVRFDYVDHIFDSVIDKGGKIPISDRITPFLLKRTISKIKRNRCYTGTMAERMGIDLKNYKKIGFDLILGEEILYKISSDFIKGILKTNKIIQKTNKKGNKSSILFAVDTHDTGHPYFNCVPYLLYGRYGVALRLFLSRFSSCGEYIRPKYEVIGMQDGTTGLYKANNMSISLKWNCDLQLFNIYNNIEDIFTIFYEKLKESTFQKLFYYKKNVVCWQFKGRDFSIISIVNFDPKKVYKNIKLKLELNYKNIECIDVYNKETSKIENLLIAYINPLHAKIIYCYNY